MIERACLDYKAVPVKFVEEIQGHCVLGGSLVPGGAGTLNRSLLAELSQGLAERSCG
jgi:hypothetical protein